MFSRCLFCHRELPRNEALEHFAIGRRVAFDPVRGRLWAVCPACHRWNLAPIEERWEALEELEKTVRDRAKLLSQTDNIALLRTPELEIVRVGRANLTEEAWWRYGVEMVRRRRLYRALTAAGVAGVLGMIAGVGAAGVGVVGSWWVVARAGRQLPKLSRTLKFGRTAWRGQTSCPRCGAQLTSIPFRSRGMLVALPDEDGGVAVGLRCLRCTYGAVPGRMVLAGEWWDSSWERRRHIGTANRRRMRQLQLPHAGVAGELFDGYRITGLDAQHLLRRVLAYQNFAGTTERGLRQATSLIESAGSAPSLTRQLAGAGRALSTMEPVHTLALEIAVNEDHERQLLELELAALEERWREEEEIAAIVDGELTWVPGRAVPGAHS